MCALGWLGNGVLLNLRPVEDYAMWCVRIHVSGRSEGVGGGVDREGRDGKDEF